MSKEPIKDLLSDWRTILVFVIGVGLFVVLLLLDRHHHLSKLIQQFGIWGVVLAIVLMFVFSMTPIPTEGLLIMYLKVYGVVFGIVYSWLGTTFSALVIFLFARMFGRQWLTRIVTPERYARINGWVLRRGSFGLLFARMLPIPAFAVNYAAGMIPSISFWTYIWTAIVSIIPYYLGACLVFLGVYGNWFLILVGIIPIGLVGLVGMIISRKENWNGKSR